MVRPAMSARPGLIANVDCKRLDGKIVRISHEVHAWDSEGLPLLLGERGLIDSTSAVPPSWEFVDCTIVDTTR